MRDFTVCDFGPASCGDGAVINGALGCRISLGMVT